METGFLVVALALQQCERGEMGVWKEAPRKILKDAPFELAFNSVPDTF